MTGFDVRDPDGTAYVSAADAEAHVRATLDRPDQVHVIAPEILRALCDQTRGYRAMLGLDGGDAGCPVGECVHAGTAHEPDEYGDDGEPVRPICCAGDCRCGQQWRNA
jgi:hypothetical protein